MNKWALLVSCWLLMGAGPLYAQPLEYAAIIQVEGEGIYFQRTNTSTELYLSDGAVAPFGSGDRIRTGENGRVLITLNEDNDVLLLPNSEYTLNQFRPDDSGDLILQAQLRGIAIHNLTEPLHYRLETETYTITEASGNFAAWNTDGLQVVTSAEGEVTLALGGGKIISLSPATGYSVPDSSNPITLAEPLHASQVIAQSSTCIGIVSTVENEGLRLRAGAALDYLVVDALYRGQEVQIVGTTHNGLWYRIPFQTGFGWIYSSLVNADCSGLPQFSNLIGEAPESIHQVTEEELIILQPFYGTPKSNTVFYR